MSIKGCYCVFSTVRYQFGVNALRATPSPGASSDLFMLAEVARDAGVHPRTLLRWAQKALIPKPMKLKANGRHVYSAEDRAIIIGFSKATIPQ